MSSTVRVSLCLVVRDEAELLPRFLSATRGAYDELVAVDTGSRDATPALLAAAGARVVHRPWDDDFSAARNASLDAARGAWILYLDPDELPSPELVRALRAVAADDGAGAAVLRFVNHVPGAAPRTAALVRMFRAHASIRFRHRIHEDACWSILPRLEAAGLSLARPAGWVDHLGYARERAAARGKRARDVGLLQRCIAEAPDDLYARLKLLEQARFWGDRALWASAAAGARDALARAEGWSGIAAANAGELLVLVADGLHPGDPAAALAFLEGWAGRAPPAAAVQQRMAELREALGRAGAADGFQRALSLSLAGDPAVPPARPLLGLARLALGRGDLDGAAPYAAAALAEAPRDREALLASAFVALARGGRAALAAFAERQAAADGDSPELRAAIAEAARLAA